MNSFPFVHLKPSAHNQPIYAFQSKDTRAINLGYIHKEKNNESFIPGRENVGGTRLKDTYQATLQSLSLPPIQTILKRYSPSSISTVTLLRETLSCNLGMALYDSGVLSHYGDAFIGATHIKGKGEITTDYQYENTEGLVNNGLWIIADSLCIGRNLIATFNHILPTFTPQEIIFIAPLASRRAINDVGALTQKASITTTFIAWGGLFGVDQTTLYDMPWGHPDTEPVDQRDQETFIAMYSKELCVGGDFGNNYYSPTISKQLYQQQLQQHHISPTIPSVSELLNLYRRDEFVIREE